MTSVETLMPLELRDESTEWREIIQTIATHSRKGGEMWEPHDERAMLICGDVRRVEMWCISEDVKQARNEGRDGRGRTFVDHVLDSFLTVYPGVGLGH